MRVMMKIAEFYSGIGGWAYAAAEAGLDEIVLSIDLSPVCNHIYAFNWGRSPVQRTIESLTTRDLEDIDIWLLSPPCQPYTQQRGPNEIKVDEADPRSKSFSHLCTLVLSAPPRHFICLENVLGFAQSKSYVRWRAALAAVHFRVYEWRTTPTEGGYPCERPRHFECAVRGATQAPPSSVLTPANMRALSEFLEPTDDDSLSIPRALLNKPAAWCLDILARDSPWPTACFTKSYSRFCRGTGSVLCLRYSHAELVDMQLDRGSSPTHRAFRPVPEWPELRYFSPREVANLLGFPAANATPGFRFPPSLSARAAWAALGNSLHVPTAAAVVRFGMQAAPRWHVHEGANRVVASSAGDTAVREDSTPHGPSARDTTVREDSTPHAPSARDTTVREGSTPHAPTARNTTLREGTLPHAYASLAGQDALCTGDHRAEPSAQRGK